MSEFERLETNRIRRHPERGVYDRQRIFQIIDEALICHVAFVHHDEPFVIPTLHARHDDMILLHGASSSRLMKHVESGQQITLAFSLVDGLVLARSVFSHSINLQGWHRRRIRGLAFHAFFGNSRLPFCGYFSGAFAASHKR